MSQFGKPRVEGKPYRVAQPKANPLTRAEKAITIQEPKAEADINNIVKRALRGQPITWLNEAAPRYGDFTETPGLMEMYDKVLKAHEAFDALPAAARRELGNDPRELFRAPKEFFERHGLMKPKEEPKPDPGKDTRDLTAALKEHTAIISKNKKPPKGGESDDA